MSRKLVDIYNDYDENTKKNVDKEVKSYLTTGMSLDQLALQINNHTGLKLQRKSVKNLISQLGYPEKDKNIIIQSKKDGATKKVKNNIDEYTKLKESVELKFSKDEIIHSYRSGKAVKKIAEEVGVSYYFMVKILEDWGVYQYAKKNFKEITEELKDKFGKNILIEKYQDENMTIKQLSKWITENLNYEVTHRQTERIIEYNKIYKSDENKKINRGLKSREELNVSISYLRKAGFQTIKDLADYFYENKKLTYNDLLVELNNKLEKCGENNEFIFTLKWLERRMTPLLPKDRLIGVSRVEMSVRDFIENKYIGKLEFSNRRIIPPLELDIVLPEKKIAFEINGLFWHSEKFGKNKDYHYNKYLLCKEKGYKLLQIWEDDWRDNRTVVEKMILNKLNLSEEEKLPARNTYVDVIANNEASNFLEKNHIQGSSSGSYYLGLKKHSDNEIVAVMVLQKNGKELNIVRFSTSAIVQGGFSKLLKYVENKYEYKSLITFSDNEISDGDLYEKNGFILDAVLPPDYKYVYGGKRKHKFLFRKENFKSNPSLIYKEGLTERELAEINLLNRVYDSGKKRWIKNKNS